MVEPFGVQMGVEVELGQRSRHLVRRFAIGAAEKLGAARRFVPLRGVLKRALGVPPSAPTPRHTSRDVRLTAFVEARALDGDISEAGLEWLIRRAAATDSALNTVEGASGRQIETALRMMGVRVSNDAAELGRALAAQALVVFDANDTRLPAARRRSDRLADIIVVGGLADDDALRFGGISVLPGKGALEAA